jgi:hypothetical protein
VSQDFRPLFHQTIPPEHLIHGLKLRICRNMIDTSEAFVKTNNGSQYVNIKYLLTLTKKVSFHGLYQTAEADFGYLWIDVLGEYEAICRTAVNQGPRGDCLMKITEGQKSRDTVPLSLFLLKNFKNREEPIPDTQIFLMLIGTVSRDFWPSFFFIKKSLLGPWFTAKSRFA